MGGEGRIHPVRRATIERVGQSTLVQSIAGEQDVRDFLERIRFALREAAATGRCESIVLTVHQHAEGCDHE